MIVGTAHAQQGELPNFAEPGDESAQYTVETRNTGLDNPCGLAVRPSSPAVAPFELYLSESGAGRVVRIGTAQPGEATPVITNFPRGEFRAEPNFTAGPLGLAFITRTRLAVGTGGLGAGKDVIALYSLPADGAALKHDQAEYSVGPVPSDSRTKTGQGQFFSLARIEADFAKAVFAASIGDADQGWALKASATGNKLADLQPFIATRPITGAASPMAVAVNPRKRAHYLLIGQMGQPGDNRDSIIGFYGPSSGAVALLLRAGLYDIVGLAYSSSGDLYAVDFAAHDASAGGVYRIDAADVDGRQSCRAVKIAAVERPTSLAFTPDGALYVTAFGNRKSPDDSPTGVLLKITPGPDAPKL